MSTETELFDLNAIVAELSNDADERHLMARTLSLLAHEMALPMRPRPNPCDPGSSPSWR